MVGGAVGPVTTEAQPAMAQLTRITFVLYSFTGGKLLLTLIAVATGLTDSNTRSHKVSILSNQNMIDSISLRHFSFSRSLLANEQPFFREGSLVVS